jgi:predicted cupin superfamily sugar epimerase
MQDLIDKYTLVPHPEGGYYAVVYESEQSVKSPIVNKVRKAVTHIYFLLLKGQVSLFHKVAHDEIWNFYEGDPLMFNSDRQLSSIRLPFVAVKKSWISAHPNTESHKKRQCYPETLPFLFLFIEQKNR